MKISFVTATDSSMASYRYHNLIPAKQLRRLGHETSILSYPDHNADIAVFSKHFNLGDYSYLRGCKSMGIQAVFHVCDNHFGGKSPVIANHYRRMIDESDMVIASTETMASVIYNETGINSVVIEDSAEFDEKEPQFEPSGQLRLLWFGHESNIPALMNAWEDVAGHKIMIVTSGDVFGKIKCDGRLVPVVPYSEKTLLDALDGCDAVILPVEDGERQLVKSPNRLIESVRRGKFVIASPIPSYLKFKSWMNIQPSIKEGIDKLAKMSSNEVRERIKQAQEYISTTHSQEKIGMDWNNALNRLGG